MCQDLVSVQAIITKYPGGLNKRNACFLDLEALSSRAVYHCGQVLMRVSFLTLLLCSHITESQSKLFSVALHKSSGSA